MNNEFDEQALGHEMKCKASMAQNVLYAKKFDYVFSNSKNCHFGMSSLNTNAANDKELMVPL